MKDLDINVKIQITGKKRFVKCLDVMKQELVLNIYLKGNETLDLDHHQLE
jgi:hypothetical protein